MMDPVTQQILMQAQTGNTDKTTPPSISREKAKELFFSSDDKKFESMKKMMSDSRHLRIESNEDQMNAMMDITVDQAIIADEMYEHHGIEEEEFNRAIIYYNLMEDPEVTRKMM
jgi:hypothetical protein